MQSRSFNDAQECLHVLGVGSGVLAHLLFTEAQGGLGQGVAPKGHGNEPPEPASRDLGGRHDFTCSKEQVDTIGASGNKSSRTWICPVAKC